MGIYDIKWVNYGLIMFNRDIVWITPGKNEDLDHHKIPGFDLQPPKPGIATNTHVAFFNKHLETDLSTMQTSIRL